MTGRVEIRDSFWNSNAGANTTTAGTARGATAAKTTAEMQDQATNIWTAAGFDFATTPVWKWSAGSGVYPTLNNAAFAPPGTKLSVWPPSGDSIQTVPTVYTGHCNATAGYNTTVSVGPGSRFRLLL